MAATRVFTSRLAATMAQTTKVARPAARFQLNAATKRTFTSQKAPVATFAAPKRASPTLLQANARTAFQTAARRQYSSEVATAMVEVSKNLGMGSAAIGLGGAGIGIGLVFAALLMSVSRNPALRGQLFSYAILGFAFVEAMGLFDLMVAMMCKSCFSSPHGLCIFQPHGEAEHPMVRISLPIRVNLVSPSQPDNPLDMGPGGRKLGVIFSQRPLRHAHSLTVNA
ncbi:unnamed protein product [Penicillium manginii]